MTLSIGGQNISPSIGGQDLTLSVRGPNITNLTFLFMSFYKSTIYLY
jgi:hypothetical protein